MHVRGCHCGDCLPGVPALATFVHVAPCACPSRSPPPGPDPTERRSQANRRAYAKLKAARIAGAAT